MREERKEPKFKIIGVGGAGGNAINCMIDLKLAGVEFIAVDTIPKRLENSKAETKIQLECEITTNPLAVKYAMYEKIKELKGALEGSHMIFIVAGLGGGTGTGAVPVIAEYCKEMLGILTVAVVSLPFAVEGKKRMARAETALQSLLSYTGTVITIPNDRLRSLAGKNTTMIDMFRKIDEILYLSVKGITDLIMVRGGVCFDFADLRTLMSKKSIAIMGIGIATGENRAKEASEKAISHPLLEDTSIVSWTREVLINVTTNSNFDLEELTEATDLIYKEVDEDAVIYWSSAIDNTMGDEMRVTVYLLGCQ